MAETETLPETVSNGSAELNGIFGFKYHDKHATIHFGITLPGGAQLRLSINDTAIVPPAELVESLNDLSGDLSDLCELHAESMSKITVTRFSCKTVKGRRAFKLCGLKELEMARVPLVLNAPLKWDSHADELQELDFVTVQKLERLAEHVKSWLGVLLEPVSAGTLFRDETITLAEQGGGKITAIPRDDTVQADPPF